MKTTHDLSVNSTDSVVVKFYQVVVLDTDVIFASDIAELWRIFDQLTGKKVCFTLIIYNLLA